MLVWSLGLLNAESRVRAHHYIIAEPRDRNVRIGINPRIWSPVLQNTGYGVWNVHPYLKWHSWSPYHEFVWALFCLYCIVGTVDREKFVDAIYGRKLTWNSLYDTLDK